MTKNIHIYILIILMGSLFLIGEDGHTQPTIPKEKIPANISAGVKEQISRLYSQDVKERADAVFALGQMREGAVPAIPFLIPLLKDLKYFQWRPSSETNEKSTTISNEAANALIKIGKPTGKFLIMALTDPHYLIRMKAAKILGELKYPQAVEPLVAALKDEDINTHENAIWSLGKIADLQAVQPLVPFLKDKEDYLREKAVGALAEIHDFQSVAPIISVLNDKSEIVRRNAIEGLGRAKDGRAVGPLINALKIMFPITGPWQQKP